MTKYIQVDKNRRILFFENEKKRKILKAIYKNSNLPLNIRQNASISLGKFPKDSSIVRIKNRCVLTGRGRSIFNSFSLSRLMLRKLARDGLIPGLKKFN